MQEAGCGADLEVAWENQVCVQGADEEVDGLGHVLVRKALKRAKQHGLPPVDLIGEYVDRQLAEDTFVDALAVGAAQQHPPARRVLIDPIQWVDQLAPAVAADVQKLRLGLVRRVCMGGSGWVLVGIHAAFNDIGAHSEHRENLRVGVVNYVAGGAEDHTQRHGSASINR